MRKVSVSGVFFAALLLAGCSSIPADWRDSTITAEQLLAAEPIIGNRPFAQVAAHDVLELSPDMQAFLDRHVPRQASDYFKMQRLLNAVISDENFVITYDNTTRTAAETFTEQTGNCLSFTNMFIALARHVGLDARFQEVDIPPDWTLERDTFILNRHVNIFVDLGRDGEQVVDFNIEDYKASYDQRVVTDARALAHYYNNIGVGHLQNQNTAVALAYFRKALVADSQFGPAWSNLGALYRRAGHYDYAEASYLHALGIDDHDHVAMSNLAGLYEEQGRSERAAWYREHVRGHRMRNPYYRFHLARQDFLAENYQAAISNLKYAVSRKEQEDSFHYLLGLSYLQIGEHKKARKSLERAEQVATVDALRRNYRSKIDLLLQSNNDAG